MELLVQQVRQVVQGSSGADGSSGAAIANWYAAYSSNIDHVQPAGNTPVAVTFQTTELENGIVLDVNQQIRAVHNGVYEISYTVQAENQDTAPHDIDIWIKKNGVDLARKDRIKTLAADSVKYMPSTPYLLVLEAGDYLELFFASASVDVELKATSTCSVRWI